MRGNEVEERGMSRNGQYGQGRPAQRRNPAEQDPYAPQWPQQPGGYPDPNDRFCIFCGGSLVEEVIVQPPLAGRS